MTAQFEQCLYCPVTHLLDNVENVAKQKETFSDCGTMLIIAPDRTIVCNKKVIMFFLFLHEVICCGYSLEVPP